MRGLIDHTIKFTYMYLSYHHVAPLRGRCKDLRWCGFALFLVRFCGNFYFNLQYCGFTRLPGLRYQESLGHGYQWPWSICSVNSLESSHSLLLLLLFEAKCFIFQLAQQLEQSGTVIAKTNVAVFNGKSCRSGSLSQYDQPLYPMIRWTWDIEWASLARMSSCQLSSYV